MRTIPGSKTTCHQSRLEKKVQAAINNLEGKAAEPDGILTEFVRLFNIERVKWLTKIFNKIRNRGETPNNWVKSEFIPIPKNLKL